MTRRMQPPELDRPGERERFDPVIEGTRHGLSPELSRAIWQRVCDDATDGLGRRDEPRAERRFHELAARIAARGGRLRPDVGRQTRVGIELHGDAFGRSGIDELRPRTPGRETLVTMEARRSMNPSEASPAPAPPRAEDGQRARSIEQALTVDGTGDHLEHDADRVAERIAPGLTPELARTRYGVHLHTDDTARARARELGARAFTIGDDIWFGASNGPDDARLLAHEVGHVMQQRAGTVRPDVVQMDLEADIRGELHRLPPEDLATIEARRLRLRGLFQLATAAEARSLYARLSTLRPGDSLSRAFYRTLATPVRNELLALLQAPRAEPPAVEEPQAEPEAPPAATVLPSRVHARLLRQADPGSRYSLQVPYRFRPGEPSLQYHMSVTDPYAGEPAVIDMRHFISVGSVGSSVGDTLELVQALGDNPESAHDPQDYFSNHLGEYFYRHIYRPDAGSYSAQMATFFAMRRAGEIPDPLLSALTPGQSVGSGLPPGGMPPPIVVSPELRAALNEHSTEPAEQFLEFLRALEAFLAGEPE